MAQTFQFNAPSFSSSPSSSFNLSPTFGFPTAAQLTQRQQIAQELAKQTRGNDSFWDKVKGGFGGVLNFALHNISRPWWAVTSAVDAATDEGGFDISDFFGGLDEGFLGKKQLGWGQLFEKWGVLEDHDFLRGLAGFGTDVVTDPLTYVFGIGIASKATRATTTITSKLLKAGSASINDTEDIIAAAKQAMTFGDEWRGTKQLAEEILRNPTKIASESVDVFGDTGQLDLFSLLKAASEAEVLDNIPRAAQLRIGVPFTGGRATVPLTPAWVGDTRIAPRPPSLGRTASGGGVVGKLPLVPKVADAVGRTFIPGFEYRDLPGWQRVQMTALHIGEHRADQLSREAINAFSQALGSSGVRHLGLVSLDKKQMTEALEWAQNGDNGLIRHTSDPEMPMGYKLELDEQVLRSAHNLTPNQQNFIQGWHKVVEIMRHADGRAGMVYKPIFEGERGALYVPHVYQKNGMALDDVFASKHSSAFSQAGFSKDRVLQLTIGQIAKLGDERLGKVIETDPMVLLAARLRRSAVKQADNLLVDVAAKIFGESVTLYDDAAIKAATAQVDELSVVKEGLQKTYTKTRKTARGPVGQRLKNLDKEIAVAEKALGNAKSGKANPDIGSNLVKRKLGDGTEVAIPTRIEYSTRKIQSFQMDDEVYGRFVGTYNKYLSKWKIAVTTINPGYRARNTLSDFWNMWLTGVPMSAIPVYGAMAAKVMYDVKKAHNKMLKGEELSKTQKKALLKMFEAYNGGVLSGLFTGDIQTLSQMINHFGSKKALFANKKFIALTGKAMTDMNRNAENWGRMTHYLFRTDFEKLSTTEAARQVRLAHFDYEELTDVERRLFKKIAPFYTWTRKNLPLQLQMLATRPGRFAAFPKFAFEMEAAAGGTERDIIPDWLSDNMAIAFPGGESLYYIPQIGAADLLKIAHPEQFLNMVTPAFKIPAELITGKDLFTGADIRGGSHDRVPVSDPVGNTLKALGLGGLANVGPTKRGIGEGEFAEGMGASPVVSWIARQTPWTNFLVNQMSDIKREQRGGVGGIPGGVLSQMAGLSFWQVNRDQELYFQGLEFQDKVDKAMRALRDRGLIPEAEVSSQSPFEAQLNQILSLNLSRGGG